MVGCDKIGKYLLEELCKMKLKIKVIEFNKERCIELAKEFPDVKVVHGDGVESQVLLEEGIKDYDACISLTGKDETNLVITLFAWSHKVRKLITKVLSLSYTQMLRNVDIDNTVSPQDIILSDIQRFIRGISESSKNNDNDVISLYRFAGNNAEAIEFEVNKSFSAIGKSLKEIKVNRNVVVAFIIRNNQIIMPNGDTTIENNDRVIVIAPKNKSIGDLEEIL